MKFEIPWVISRAERMATAVLFLVGTAMLLGAALPKSEVNEAFGAPAPVRWFFGHTNWGVAVLAFFFCALVMFVLASAWEGVFRPSQYLAYSIADPILVPILFWIFGEGIHRWNGTDKFYADWYVCVGAFALSAVFSLLNANNDRKLSGGWLKAFSNPYAFYHAFMLWAMVGLGLTVTPIMFAVSWRLSILAAVVFIIFFAFPWIDLQRKRRGNLPLEGRTLAQY